jgi:hypothetical protein
VSRNKQQKCRRHRQFELARNQKGVSREGLYILAGSSMSPPVPKAKAINDCGRHALAFNRTKKFTAPKYVHDYVGRVLGLIPQTSHKKTVSDIRPAYHRELTPAVRSQFFEARA